VSDQLLQVQDLSFSYPGRHVFSAWSCGLGAGVHWLRGSNGVQVRGVELDAQPLAYRREVFWCGPGAIAFEHLRPPEYFAFLRGLYPRLDEATLQAQVTGFGLQPFLAKPLQALSTGTQRKVWLAAALSVGTPLVLLDEPLNALDVASLDHLHGQLADRAARATQAWLVASHEPLGVDVKLASVIELTSA
jgi:ABC-2 type transport system ATP-binding protein